jgi:hypothetical protein
MVSVQRQIYVELNILVAIVAMDFLAFCHAFTYLSIQRRAPSARSSDYFPAAFSASLIARHHQR